MTTPYESSIRLRRLISAFGLLFFVGGIVSYILINAWVPNSPGNDPQKDQYLFGTVGISLLGILLVVIGLVIRVTLRAPPRGFPIEPAQDKAHH